MRPSFTALASVLLALATNAEPRDPGDVVAVVLGQEITVEDAMGTPITSLIGDPLTQKFAEDNGIQPTEEELAGFVERMLGMRGRQLRELESEKARLGSDLELAVSSEEREEIQGQLDTVVATLDSLSEAEVQMNADLLRPMAMRWIQRWKIFKALYEKYGGRAHFQQAGIEPFDAVRDFLEEQEANGAFTILDRDYEDEFWHYWRNEQIHTFVPEGQEHELISTPWWLMEAPDN